MICAASLTAYAGTGTAADPYSVAEVIAMGADLNVASASVKGYIVGYVNGQVITTGATFNATGASASNVLIADAQNCTDVTACVPVQLVAQTDIRSKVNLKDNPGNLGKTLTITGQLIKYFGVPGVKAPTAYTLDGAGVTPPPTPQGPVTSLDENFDAGSIPANWSQVQVAGNKSWYTPSFQNNYYAAMTGYKGTAPFDQWLLTPAIDMSKVTDKTLTFDTQVNGYGSTTSVLEVYVLSSNDVATATKTKLNPTLAVAPESGYSSWVASGNLDLSAQSGTVYIGFRYYATEDANYATWCVDNVKLNTGATPTPEATEVNSIAEFLALPLESVGKIKCPVTAVYQNGSYLYVTDGTTPLLVYGKLNSTYKNGDVIAAGITGTNFNYSEGQLQMSNPDATTFGAPTAGTAVEPEVYQIEELSADMVSSYIKILGVKVVAGATDKEFTLSDNTGDIALYNQFGVSVGAGENLTFTGVVGVHGGKLQVLPVADLGEGGGPTPPTPSDPNVAYFFAPSFEGKTGCALMNKDGSTTLTNDDTKDETKGLNDKLFTEKGVSLKFAHGTGEYYVSSFGNQVRWYQGETATLTPAAGVTIIKVFVQTVANSKGAFTAETGTVEGTGVGAANPITWTGSTTSALVLTSAKQIRFSYIEVTTKGFSGVENVTVSDENAPVEYYNLQGIRVSNPQGGIFLRRQGNTVTKVLVK